MFGTHARTEERLREKPFPIIANAQTETPEYKEYQKLLDEGTRRYMIDQMKHPEKYKVTCKAMTPQCMGKEKYDEYVSGHKKRLHKYGDASVRP